MTIAVPPSNVSPLRAWVLATRPRTLPAATAPVVVGSALAWRDGVFHPGLALAALAGALLLQIGSNFANDYFDFKKGADTEARLGPTRATASGLISERGMIAGMAVVFGLAVAVGLYLAAVGGWPIVAIGVAGIVCAILYTGGPFPLGYLGLGEVAVFLFFGLAAVTGTYYVQAHAVTPASLLLAVPPGLLSAGILLVNNIRDAETDAPAGKRTLAVRFGRPFARGLYAASLGAALLLPALLAAAGRLPWAAAAPVLAFPLAVPLLKTVLGPVSGPAYNKALGGTGKLLLVSSLLLAAGLVLG